MIVEGPILHVIINSYEIIVEIIATKSGFVTQKMGPSDRNPFPQVLAICTTAQQKQIQEARFHTISSHLLSHPSSCFAYIYIDTCR